MEDLKAVLISILRTGILRIRQLSAEGHADRCAAEADHLHNLPDMIAKPNLEALAYYLDVERPAFIRDAVHIEQFEHDWHRLDSIVSVMRG